VDGFGKVDKVNNITPDTSKNVKTDYVYETEAGYEADKANIPTGATVVKLYEYPDNIAGFMIVPDYANIETANRWSNTITSWTADRTGFVRCYVREGVGISPNEECTVKVNGQEAFRFTNASHTPNANLTLVFPIKKGDVVSRPPGNDSEVYCRFIPPLFIKKEMPVIVEKNGSYSLEEIKTADTWIDGKPIYKRTVNCGQSAWTSKNAKIVGASQGESLIVKTELCRTISDSRMGGLPCGCYVDGTDLIAYPYADFGVLTNGNYYLTIYYTKSTD
jgi:hypothetical protein